MTIPAMEQLYEECQRTGKSFAKAKGLAESLMTGVSGEEAVAIVNKLLFGAPAHTANGQHPSIEDSLAALLAQAEAELAELDAESERLNLRVAYGAKRRRELTRTIRRLKHVLRSPSADHRAAVDYRIEITSVSLEPDADGLYRCEHHPHLGPWKLERHLQMHVYRSKDHPEG